MKFNTSTFYGLPTLLLISGISQGAMTDFAALPPTQITGVDPNVMINLSIETPMQGAAYNDWNDGGSCPGRPSSEGGNSIGTCYFPAQEYIGIFDPEKCYTYSSSYFSPAGATGANHTCSGQWSGNFLNWATMTAIDEFRWALTGGNRYIDTATETVLQRANMGLSNGHSWFPVKKLRSSINVAPSTVTPYSNPTIYITSYDYRMKVGTSAGYSNIANDLYVRAKVCDSSNGLEDNCQPYGSHYKPEGLMQQNAKRMRFAVMSYLRNSDHGSQGGVLRANMKYVGPEMPATGGGLTTNPEAEWDAATGVFASNPNPTDATASGVANSGVINYINKFGANGYKSYDPIGELFYECLNYFKGRGATSDFYSGATLSEKDDFPLITTWTDPIQHACQSNYIIGINDANPWEDKRLPGTAATSSSFSGHSWNWSSNDWGNPSNSDPDINVTTLTNTVGDLQGITGTSQCVGCVPGNCNMSASNKTISALGRAFGTCPYAPKENSYYIAGLAYYARSQDIRTEASLPGRQTVTTFMIDTQEYSSTPLTGQMNMLWLAGKFGGFNEFDNADTNGDGITLEPNAAGEWDEDGDGEPDNYVLATNPQKLVSGLAKAFKDISERISSGSAAAVVGNTANGNGAIVQALYQPKINNTVKKQQFEWGGILHAIFVDHLGNLREDNQSAGTQGALDDYTTDKVIQLFYDSTVVPNRTRVQRYDTSDGKNLTASGLPVELSDLGVVWNSRDLLAETSANTDAQRNYTTAFDATGTPRHIFTGVDKNTDGQIDGNEVEPFTASDMSSYFRYFDVSTSAEAANIINFIRGKEGISGFRSRTIDYDGDGIDEVWRLGDIIHSSPTIVGPPKENYDVLHGDYTYARYKETYANRRQVAYVGANDGMLHAFNMGFYNATTNAFELSPHGETAHPLGAEIWAYVPGNLLPHLQWLANPEYPHIYYVDGPVQQFDVNIFTPDATHVDGWGTIIVVGMRFGGGAIDLDTDDDGTDDYTTRSAFIILDVTDPESPPTLLAEISDDQLGFSTSLPGMYTFRQPLSGADWDNLSSNYWYLVFGSGPTELATAESTQNAGVYVFDLPTKSFLPAYAPWDLGIANSFTGNFAVQDWDKDWWDDSAYFGLTAGTIASTTGRLMQFNGSSSTLFVAPAGQSIVGRPTFATDEQGNGWVYFGTGRLFVQYDNESVDQQALYGIKDPSYTNGTPGFPGSVVLSDLQETTGVIVYADHSLEDPNGVISPALSENTFEALQSRIATKDGWYRNLNSSVPSERSFTNAQYFLGFLLATSYEPSADICTPEGSSYLHALYYKTGTAFPDAGLGNSNTDFNASSEPKTLEKIVLGQGVASDVIIVSDGSSGQEAVAATNLSTGVLTANPISPPVSQSGRQSWIEIEQ
jgi:Tfp pilus tip-associated adhesin PilY1